MKHSMRILIVFLISSANALACGPWYPYGEELRFSLIDPTTVDDGGMSPYYYTSEGFGWEYRPNSGNDPNVQLWSAYCGGKVPGRDIFWALNYADEYDIRSEWTDNAFLKHLQKNDDQEVLNYLEFAVSCSHLNSVDEGWEWYYEDLNLSRNRYILEALKKSATVKNQDIKRRYRFLALRLAYYKKDQERTIAIYDKCFSHEKADVIDYWALYFVTLMRDETPQRNCDLAQVFAKDPGKRFGCITGFNSHTPIEDVLAVAKTNAEKANVYALYAVRERGISIESIKKIHALDANHPMLTFLLTREVNKLEDWVLTPRYTRFPPTVRDEQQWDDQEALIQERIKDDQAYGKQLLNWLGTAKLSNDAAPILRAHLSGITGSPSAGLTILGDPSGYSMKVQNMANQVKLVLKVQANASSSLTASERYLLMSEKAENYNELLFAVAREYEYQQKYAEAAALFSHVNSDLNSWEGAAWKATKGRQSLQSDFYTDYFFYMDGEYTPEQVQAVIDFTKKNSANFTEYDFWLRTHVQADVSRLYDLLGTKYIRQHKMDAAISAFKNVKPGLWDSDKYYYKQYLNANPFHADFYSAHAPTDYDTVSYNKLEILETYKAYLAKAENPSTKNRAYYYFLLGNCELNMSQYGNSWMMRRYYWTENLSVNNFEDDDEYYRLKRAKSYYLKARELSSDSEIKSLCTRMAVRCEKHQLYFDVEYDWEEDYDQYGGFANFISEKNKLLKELRTNYPDDAEELLGNCYSFQRYFAKMQ